MTNPYPIPKRYLEQAAVDRRRQIDPRLVRWATEAKDASGAVLVGPTGCGKSLAASWAADRIGSRNSATWVKWIRADELSRLLSERGAVEQLTQVKQARLLVIDEIGYERFPELLLEVIGARHDASRPTIVTSGLRLDAIALRYSDATVRRIESIGGGCVVDCWRKP